MLCHPAAAAACLPVGLSMIDSSDASGPAVNRTGELRSAPRKATFLKGSIVLADGTIAEHVSIQNLSAGGARLKVESGWAVAEEITLDIPARRERRQCHVRWRLSNAVGVLFTDRPRAIPRPPCDDVAARLIELEQEVQRLQAENRELRTRLQLSHTFRFS